VSAGGHHTREGDLGGVEAVDASCDEPDFVVERSGAALVDPEPDRVKDPVAVAADRAGEPDEGGESAAGRLGDEAVDQERDVGEREARLEDRSERVLAHVGAPDLGARAPESPQRRGLGAWPTAPVTTSNAVQMTMSCDAVRENQYLFAEVIYGDLNLPIGPDHARAQVIGAIADIAPSACGYKELVVQAASVQVQMSGDAGLALELILHGPSAGRIERPGCPHPRLENARR
jgi:hypothetical protein